MYVHARIQGWVGIVVFATVAGVALADEPRTTPAPVTSSPAATAPQRVPAKRPMPRVYKAPPAALVPAQPTAPRNLDLRVGDVRRYMMPREFSETLNATDDERVGVIVEGYREAPRLESEKPVPAGLFAPVYAVMNPLQAWRVLAPDPNAPPPPPPNPVPPPVFRWGP